jgi:hypothetical protein
MNADRSPFSCRARIPLVPAYFRLWRKQANWLCNNYNIMSFEHLFVQFYQPSNRLLALTAIRVTPLSPFFISANVQWFGRIRRRSRQGNTVVSQWHYFQRAANRSGLELLFAIHDMFSNMPRSWRPRKVQDLLPKQDSIEEAAKRKAFYGYIKIYWMKEIDIRRWPDNISRAIGLYLISYWQSQL